MQQYKVDRVMVTLKNNFYKGDKGMEKNDLVWYEIKDARQANKTDKDEIKIECWMHIAAEQLEKSVTYIINRKLILGNRLNFCDENLTVNWGNLSDDKLSRVRIKTFCGTTYDEAIMKLNLYVEQEISKIVDFYLMRQLKNRTAGTKPAYEKITMVSYTDAMFHEM